VKTRLLLAAAAALAVALPASPAAAAAGSCAAADPGAPVCSYYTTGRGDGLCAASRCYLSFPGVTTAVYQFGLGDTFWYEAPYGTLVQLRVVTGTGTVYDATDR
jgi:hypothetical protein